jgi:hypothetical protein
VDCYCWLCSGRGGRGTGFGLVCGMDTAVCVLVEWEELQGFGLICGLVSAGFVVVEWERDRGWFSLWI